MAVNTYVALAKTVVSNTSTTSVVLDLSSIVGYTDIRVVIKGGMNAASLSFPYCYINSNTGSNYSGTALIGNGSTAFSERNTSYTKCGNFSAAWINNLQGFYTIDFLQYANTSVPKTAIWRINGIDASGYAGVGAATTLWRGSTGSSTEAITSLDFRLTMGGTDYAWANGTTFTVYGFKAWAAESTPKATGGEVYSDSTYWYHVFKYSGTLVPNTALTCDYLLIAGGGGGGGDMAGGGGAGGLRSTLTATGGLGTLESAISLSSGTTYTIAVGAGGAAQFTDSSNGYPGSNSSISGTGLTTLTAIGGGYGGYYDVGGGAGGSGGGAGRTPSGGGGTRTASPVQGFNGGGGSGSSSTTASAGGGGGAGAVGVTGSTSGAGAGGVGLALPVFATATSTGVDTYYAGGGGGGAYDAALAAGGLGGGGGGGKSGLRDGQHAVSATGSGGGGGGPAGGNGGSGGSGIVIVRYAK